MLLFGKSDISCWHGCTECLKHVPQSRMMRLISLRASKGQYSKRILDSTVWAPACPERTCFFFSNHVTRWFFDDNSIGCFWLYWIWAFDNRPLTRIRPSVSRKGFNENMVLLVIGLLCFNWDISLEKTVLPATLVTHHPPAIDSDNTVVVNKHFSEK